MRDRLNHVRKLEFRGHVSPNIPKLPVFDDTPDEVDSFLLRFERYAEAQNWDKSDWA